MEQAKLSSGNFANVLLDGGAAAASDETFLEQTKLKAQEALENALLYDDTTAASEEAWLQRAKLKAQRTLKTSGNDRQADSDDGILEQAKPENEKAWRISFQAMVRLRAPMKQFLEQAKLEPEKPGNALLAEGEAREALQKVLVDDDAEEQPHCNTV